MILILSLTLSACTGADDDQPPAPPTVEIVREATPEPELTPDPSSTSAPTTSSASASSAATTTQKRIDCLFVDPDRQQDADGRVTVKCGEETFQATATYKGEGAYEFEIPASATPAPPTTSVPDAEADAK